MAVGLDTINLVWLLAHWQEINPDLDNIYEPKVIEFSDEICRRLEVIEEAKRIPIVLDWLAEEKTQAFIVTYRESLIPQEAHPVCILLKADDLDGLQAYIAEHDKSLKVKFDTSAETERILDLSAFFGATKCLKWLVEQKKQKIFCCTFLAAHMSGNEELKQFCLAPAAWSLDGNDSESEDEEDDEKKDP
jgi:hypothetical protein